MVVNKGVRRSCYVQTCKVYKSTQNQHGEKDEKAEWNEVRRRRKEGSKEGQKKRPPPRKTKYTAKTAVVVEKLMLGGMNLTEVCDTLCIERTTLWKWRQRYPEMAEAVENGREGRADGLEDVAMDMAYPHDEVIKKVKKITLEVEQDEETIKVPAVQTETITKQGVVSEKLLVKVLEAKKPATYGTKKLEHPGTITVAAMLAAAVKSEKND